MRRLYLFGETFRDVRCKGSKGADKIHLDQRHSSRQTLLKTEEIYFRFTEMSLCCTLEVDGIHKVGLSEAEYSLRGI